MNPAGPPVLVLRDVAVNSIHRPGLMLLDHVDWTVTPGESWVVGGLPASGKSDLLATAAGLVRPWRGRVDLFGVEVSELREEERLRIQLRVGMVFGYGGRLFNGLTVGENLALPLCYHHNCEASGSQERVTAVLDAMGLSSVAQQTPIAINRNLRQRVALARALVLAPELLFLDNPLAGLDPRESRWWMEFLRDLQQPNPLLEGRALTLVVGTDDLRPWSGENRRLALIDHHRFVPIANRDEIAALHTPALRELLPNDWLGT